MDVEEKIRELASAIRAAVGDIGSPKVYTALAAAAVLHAVKNVGYRSSVDSFANFRENPVVTKGLLNPLQYAYVLMSKQDDAVPRLVFGRGEELTTLGDEYKERGGDEMLRERLMDGIVYRAIMLAMLD